MLTLSEGNCSSRPKRTNSSHHLERGDASPLPTLKLYWGTGSLGRQHTLVAFGRLTVSRSKASTPGSMSSPCATNDVDSRVEQTGSGCAGRTPVGEPA